MIELNDNQKELIATAELAESFISHPFWEVMKQNVENLIEVKNDNISILSKDNCESFAMKVSNILGEIEGFKRVMSYPESVIVSKDTILKNLSMQKYVESKKKLDKAMGLRKILTGGL